MPTIKDLAKASGYSTATISKALHDKSDVSKETKRQVKALAEKMGFRPSQAALQMRLGKPTVVGLLVAQEDSSSLSISTAELIAYVRNNLEESGYSVMITSELKTRMAGVLAINVSEERLGIINEPVVFLGREALSHSCVFMDSLSFTYSCARELLQEGCSQILLIQHSDRVSAPAEVNGYFRACLEYGSERDPAFVIDISKAQDMLPQSIKSNRKKGIILTDATDYHHINRIINSCEREGDCPQFAVCACRTEQKYMPSLLTYEYPTEIMGQAAVSKLMEYINLGEYSIREAICVPGAIKR